MRVCVHGNIGAGKTTFIQRFFPGFEKVPEPVSSWEVKEEDLHWVKTTFPTDNIFQRYNNALSHDVKTSVDYVYMLLFQCVVMRTRAEMYQNLDPNKDYIFERSIEEDMCIFGRNLPLPQPMRETLEGVYRHYKRFEPVFDANIYLRESTEVLMQRIRQRARPGEQISEQYLVGLQKKYNEFIQ